LLINEFSPFMTNPENPYSPSATSSTDEIVSRPFHVALAVSLLIVAVVAGLVYLIATRGITAERAISVSFISFGSFLFCRSIYRGRAWARWAVLAIIALMTVTAPWRFTGREFIYHIIFGAQLLALFGAGVFLLLPSSAVWFRPRRSAAKR
jgi:hypothetical protein